MTTTRRDQGAAAPPPPQLIATVTHTFTEQDYADAFDLYEARFAAIDPAWKSARDARRATIVLALAVTAAVAAGFTWNLFAMRDEALPLGVIFAAQALMCWSWAYSAWKPLTRSSRKAARNDYLRATAEPREPVTFAIETDGFRIRTERYDFLYRWAALHDVLVLPNEVLIFQTHAEYSRVPRSAFATDDAFRAYADAASEAFAAAGGRNGRLRSFLASTDAPCPACGYNLRGVATRLCPECGTAIPDSIMSPPGST